MTSGGASERRIKQLRQGLQQAIDDPALAEPRAALLLEGVRLLPENAYVRIIELEDLALAHGYPALN